MTKDINNSLALLEEVRTQIQTNDGKPLTQLAISLVSAAKQALEEANYPIEVNEIRYKLKGIEIYLKRQRAELINSNLVAAQRMRTERKLGKMIPEFYPHGKHSPNTMLGDGISWMQSSRWQKMAHICDDEDFEIWVNEKLEEEELTSILFLKTFANFHVSDDSYEWYTPKEYVEAARDVMGKIDIDPASTEIANKVIQAETFYTQEDDGLAQSWGGNIWLNPPYNMPYIEQFVDRVIYEYENGNINSAIVLVNNSTDTGWFHRLLVYPVCLTKGRIHFWSESGNLLATRQGQALFYLGKNIDLFFQNFTAFGDVLVKYDNRQPR